MLRKVEFRPALFRRAFFVTAGLLLGTGAAHAAPPTRQEAPLAQIGKPDAAEAARILSQFRRSGWYGYVEFNLRALPHRKPEMVYQGRLWGGTNEQGPVVRIELKDGKGTVHRFLLQNGERAGVWRSTGGMVSQMEAGALLEPLIPGVEVTPFDLQMPFLYWPGAEVESVARVRGRPAYVFVFTPPAEFSARNPNLKRVRSYFDAQFNAPLQVDLMAARDVMKTTSLKDLKKVGEDWIPKSFDIRNNLTRNKTRFEVTAVALRMDFAPAVFAPAHLNEDVRAPAADRLVRIDP